MRNVSDRNCRENQYTHFTIYNYFQKLCCLWDNVEKCGQAKQATNDNIGYEHTLKIM
jgi:hypothetical protein